MFAGIIREVSKVKKIKKTTGGISIHLIPSLSVDEGDSLAVNGVCLTVDSLSGRTVILNAVSETLKRTNFSTLKTGDYVNIEPSLKMGDRLDGHFVYGHIDSTAKIKKIKKEQSQYKFSIELPDVIKRYVAEKGSIAVDGISLTVSGITDSTFEVSIVPYTFGNTNLKYRKRGDSVNIEIDPISRYIEKLQEE